MLLHRNAFIEKMQISEDKMMKFIDKIPKILDATKFEELPL